MGDPERPGGGYGPVLITGECGTGKDLAARALHDPGARGKSTAPVSTASAANVSLTQV